MHTHIQYHLHEALNTVIYILILQQDVVIRFLLKIEPLMNCANRTLNYLINIPNGNMYTIRILVDSYDLIQRETIDHTNSRLSYHQKGTVLNGHLRVISMLEAFLKEL